MKYDFPDIERRGGHTASGQAGMVVLGESQEEGTGGTAFDKLKTAYVACRNSEDSFYYFGNVRGLDFAKDPSRGQDGDYDA